MTVRAKFYAAKVETNEYGQTNVSLFPVTSSVDNEENKRFWEATPNGHLSMCITNKDAATQFEQGREYYLDFTPIATPAELRAQAEAQEADLTGSVADEGPSDAPAVPAEDLAPSDAPADDLAAQDDAPADSTSA